MKKKLSELLPDYELADDVTVSGIQTDSRQVGHGELFLAVSGARVDGRNYIDSAIRAGAAAVLYEPGWQGNTEKQPIPLIEVDNLKNRIGEIASRFFDCPSRQMLVIAVTGTNGKTSCTHFLAAALTSLGRDCAVIGTLGYGREQRLTPIGMTTPGALEMQIILSRLREDGVNAVAAEASSHGLVQGRLNGTEVDVAVLTNLTRDHLDYHQDMNGYKSAKKILFGLPSVSTVVLNLDDSFGVELDRDRGLGKNKVTYSIRQGRADVSCSDLRLDVHGLSAFVSTPWGSGVLKSKLFGRFNVSNLLAVIAVLGSNGFLLDDVLAALAQVRNVRGRMDRISRSGKSEVVIDYAHTPDALSKALQAVREHCTGKVWSVFGCGGDRDKGKRPLMGEVAESLSDFIVLTSDNPRTEDAGAIIDDILKGIRNGNKAHVEEDRSAAIRYALDNAAVEDVVLVAGKGHETYQEVGTDKHPFSDYEEVMRTPEAAN